MEEYYLTERIITAIWLNALIWGVFLSVIIGDKWLSWYTARKGRYGSNTQRR